MKLTGRSTNSLNSDRNVLTKQGNKRMNDRQGSKDMSIKRSTGGRDVKWIPRK
jgi:hypothetical protein